MTAPGGARPWHEVAEKGAVLGIEILVWASRLVGRRLGRLLLHPVAAWYLAFHADVRRASRAYLARVLGRATLADVYRHVLCFARVTFDRLFLVRGEVRPFAVSFRGDEELRALRDAGRGAILILAHLGSFEVMRAFSRQQALPVHMLGYFRNARMVNAALRRLNPDAEGTLVEIRPDDPTFVFEVEALVASGALVGTMGDRVGFDGKAVRVPFLGAQAALPTGPYLLAAALRCPIYVAFGIYREPNRYELSCELLAARVDLPRQGRQEALAALAARYASRLEAACRDAPYNWFNFYDFWSAT
jgi:predicted LPLAT superfamily acyltransferase